jgi:SAM-dependent methyltransferase
MRRLELIFLPSASGVGYSRADDDVRPIRWYDRNISDVSRRYESVAAETVHGRLVDLLPNPLALVLDVGVGTGRDADWLASRGLQVIAVEPSGAMDTRSASSS